jgi:hypothetical protein
MPLKKGPDKANIFKNIKVEIAHGGPQKKALVVAVKPARKTKKGKK